MRRSDEEFVSKRRKRNGERDCERHEAARDALATGLQLTRRPGRWGACGTADVARNADYQDLIAERAIADGQAQEKNDAGDAT